MRIYFSGHRCLSGELLWASARLSLAQPRVNRTAIGTDIRQAPGQSPHPLDIFVYYDSLIINLWVGRHSVAAGADWCRGAIGIRVDLRPRPPTPDPAFPTNIRSKIGRASCRERVCQSA